MKPPTTKSSPIMSHRPTPLAGESLSPLYLQTFISLVSEIPPVPKPHHLPAEYLVILNSRPPFSPLVLPQQWLVPLRFIPKGLLYIAAAVKRDFTHRGNLFPRDTFLLDRGLGSPSVYLRGCQNRTPLRIQSAL